MPSKRVIRGLNDQVRGTKPVTPAQEQLQARRQQDLEHTAKSTAAILKRLKDEHNRPPPLRDDLHPPHHEEDNFIAPHDMDIDEPPDDDPGEAPNLNRFMPDPHHVEAEPVDPVVAALRRDQHLADRLNHENKWLWQYAVMLPTFLRCKMETSNWGRRREVEARLTRTLHLCDCDRA
ncbi:uncharacterized protein MELLADRAFT_69939 [Melampsora larici-populina 98AG31]|uniref:Uncharacterized protein n=1 Tax=Melampsora larici-populina (strain 98AG31 / pathotype 3-4-7) TaxID=747676 RepID=F4SCV9_MELLP|nr:uncharacterized protein MELLADRAFT_69939 [Melampsora larici-populina 98AG31]EGF97520.1 hypothetical protein MELLADRAFT_69939 [Melampsora larici-populina 98AG31]